MALKGPVYVVQLTPPGRGAIATLRVEGRGALEVVGPMVRTLQGQPRRSFPVDRPLLVRFGPEPAEEVVLRCFTHGAVEIHCHGGRAAVGRIESLLLEAGCQPLPWQEWVRQQTADPMAAEAWTALAGALTERTAGILLDQLQGALRREIEKMLEALDSDPAALADSLARLLARRRLGEHLTQPWEVVLVGRPNVGKSSLINALVGYSRAIVHPEPGTTRDVLTAATALEGWPVHLVDTAGWRESDDPIEQAGMALARQTAQQADLVVLVTDATQLWTEAEAALEKAFPNGLIVYNKCDLLPRTAHGGSPQGEKPPLRTGRPRPAEDAGRMTGKSARTMSEGNREPAEDSDLSLEWDWEQGGRPSGVWVSALTGEGLKGLAQHIAARLVPDLPPSGAAVPFTPRQVEALQSAQQSLGRRDLPGVLRALQRLLTPEGESPWETPSGK